MRGGWLGVDVFFVLSGFLITSLLLSEHARWGRIDLVGFWLARARRLLPALVLMLLATSIAAAFWAPVARRGSDAWDMVSAMFYVANWRFILSDDEYFSSLAMPSPVQHTWSLAIEEQFYLVFPLLLACLLLIASRSRHRRILIAGPLALLAALSAWRMFALYVPGANPSRIYYGTDTRAFELLIGAFFGVLMVGRDFGGKIAHDRVASVLERAARVLAIPALIVLGAAFVLLDENSAIPFRGGMAVLCGLTMAPILAGASRQGSAAQAFLAAEPLRRLGLISYSLYVWHWPVIVFLGPGNLSLPDLPRALVQTIVAVGLACLTYRYVELPVRSGGLRALVASRPTTGRLAAAVVAVALAVALVALPRSTVGAAQAHGTGIKVTVPAYTPMTTRHSVTLIGNSIPDSLQRAFPQGQFPDLSVSADVDFGCDPFPGVKSVDGKAGTVGAACPAFRKAWPAHLRAAPPDLAIFMVPQSITSDMQVDGKRLVFGSAAYLSWLRSMLNSIRHQSLAAGAKKFAVGTLACHNMPAFTDEFRNINDDKRVGLIDKQVRSWASSAHTPVIDFERLLCAKGYDDTINGTPLYKDYLHYTAQSGAIVWGWMAPQIQRILLDSK